MDSKQKNTKFLFFIFAVIFVLIYVFTISFSRVKSYNLMVKLTQNNNIASDDIVLVVIDDKSLSDIGRWPWQRDYYLEIFDYFESYTNARLVGYDGLIVAPDEQNPESDKKFFASVGNFKKLTTGLAYSYDEFNPNIDKEEYNKLLKSKLDIEVIDKRSKKYNKNYFKSFTVLQKEYFKNLLSQGAVNIPEDYDGYIRRASQLLAYNGDLYPSLSLQMYSKYTGIDKFILSDKFLYGFSNNNILKIPIENDKLGFITNYICFYKTSDNVYSHKKYSASDVINSYRAIKKGQKAVLDPELFDNKFVFVGANANAQALADVQRTAIAENFSGLDIQATNFNNLIKNDFYRYVSYLYDFLMYTLIFVIVLLLASSIPIAPALLSSVCVMLLYLIFAYFMYKSKIALSIITPEIGVIVALLCAYSYKYLMEDSKKNKIQKAMGKYLSYDVMQNVVKNIDNIELGGSRADITVLFADIRNFTSISENMDASEVTTILNEYFSAMVPIIENHNGILNKFMGDAILAIFGSNKKSENHALDAVICADKMLKKVKHLQDKWLELGKPKIEIGIGISSGEAFIGNIGSQERLEYTVIGDTVNTASRIENYNKVYRTNFLISESTYERVQEYVDAITIKNVVIRGKSNKINLYEVVRINK